MRPKCNRPCCSGRDGDADTFLVQYYSMGYSTKAIGKVCSRSGAHIAMRLRGIGAKMRMSEDYERKRGGGRKRKSRLWTIPERDLFETKMSVLMERYGVCANTVSTIRKRRKSERVS